MGSRDPTGLRGHVNGDGDGQLAGPRGASRPAGAGTAAGVYNRVAANRRNPLLLRRGPSRPLFSPLLL